MNTLKQNRKQFKKVIKKLVKAVNSLNSVSKDLYKTYKYNLPDFALDGLISEKAVFLSNTQRMRFFNKSSSFYYNKMLEDYSTLKEISNYLIKLRILRQEHEVLIKIGEKNHD